MQRFVVLAALITLLIVNVPAAADGEVIHRSTWRSVDLESPLPADLTDPEGKTRWELADVALSAAWTRVVREAESGSLSVRETRSGFTAPIQYGSSARDWWLPHLATAGSQLQFSEISEQKTDELWVRTQALGSGWVFLDSGPREARLQRSLVMRSIGGAGRFFPDRVVYRWIDPRAGAVAEVWGRPSADGSAIVEFEGAATIESVLQGGLPLKIFQDEIETVPFQRVTLGFDRKGKCTDTLLPCVETADCPGAKCTIPISDLTDTPYATMGDLITGVWDFTPTGLADSRYEIGSTTVPINMGETCSYQECGFLGNTAMGREDKNFKNFAPDRQDLFITLSATEGEQRAGDYTIWLRAGVRHEGITTGALGETESRFCYSGGNSPDVPLWRFDTQDVGGEWYMQNGDSWSHPQFSCNQLVFSHICPADCEGLNCVYIDNCSGTATNPGTQSSQVIAEGPVTLPSGHVMNALLIRQVVDFCVYATGLCFIPVDQVEQSIYLWVVPNIGTVIRLMSEQNESSETTFTDLQETDLKYGLFPPVSINLTGQTDTTISFSWNPGTITHHISDYKVYWDTDSGSSSTYAFDSDANPGQASISVAGKTATISGLTPGTDYFFTVTAISDYYTNPAAGNPPPPDYPYESLLFPASTSGTSGPLPPELVATTIGGSFTPGESSAPGLQPLLVTDYASATGDISISYESACGTDDNNVYYGPLDQVSSYPWDEICSIGTSGNAVINPAGASVFFVVVGNKGADEGSYGRDSQGTERPPLTVNVCGETQDLSNVCIP